MLPKTNLTASVSRLSLKKTQQKKKKRKQKKPKRNNETQLPFSVCFCFLFFHTTKFFCFTLFENLIFFYNNIANADIAATAEATKSDAALESLPIVVEPPAAGVPVDAIVVVVVTASFGAPLYVAVVSFSP